MYKLQTGDNGVLLGNKTIPADPANGDWRKYQVWLAEGNTPLPADPAPPPPSPTPTGDELLTAIKALADGDRTVADTLATKYAGK